MTCTCKTCNGILFEHEMNLQPYESIAEEPAPKSVHDRLGELHTQMKERLRGVDFLTDELFSIMEEVDSIDSDIVDLQRGCLNEPKEHTQVMLGEISKKLY